MNTVAIGAHAHEARAVGFPFLLRCGQEHQPQDEARYLASLQRRNPALYQLALITRLPCEKDPA